MKKSLLTLLLLAIVRSHLQAAAITMETDAGDAFDQALWYNNATRFSVFGGHNLFLTDRHPDTVVASRDYTWPQGRRNFSFTVSGNNASFEFEDNSGITASISGILDNSHRTTTVWISIFTLSEDILQAQIMSINNVSVNAPILWSSKGIGEEIVRIWDLPAGDITITGWFEDPEPSGSSYRSTITIFGTDQTPEPSPGLTLAVGGAVLLGMRRLKKHQYFSLATSA